LFRLFGITFSNYDFKLTYYIIGYSNNLLGNHTQRVYDPNRATAFTENVNDRDNETRSINSNTRKILDMEKYREQHITENNKVL
jgi:hypothetical protein